jgi:hypothetical protein
MVDVEIETYFQIPAREHMLTNPEEVQDAIRGFKVGKAPGPNGIPNRALNIYPCGRYSFLSYSSMWSSAPSTLEALPSDFHTQTAEVSGTALILPAH